MEDFLMRSIAKEVELKQGPKVFGSLRATRTRLSNGESSIEIRVDTEGSFKNSYSMIFSSNAFGDFYEQAALETAQLLNEIIENKCKLPEIENI
ncbi:MAG: hypothetical protein R3250_00130 [Melioribacteraceae bacterium]|nr:hypothetical protein [Melioribacteraceae bacterium]